ncbi:MAG TPA: manganese efflux pump MntP family protein [Kofleriaceae bacterium]
MSFGSILLLAFGLAMDAMAVAAARGAATERLRARDALFVAGMFGGFHALMPALGWMAGSQLGAMMASWDHWVAFAILVAIGLRTIAQAFQPQPEVEANPLAPRVILVLALATSVDALAVGATLPLVGAPPFLAITTIASVAGLASLVAVVAGQWVRRSVGRPAGIVGGCALVGIGTKILVEHLTI